MKTEYFMPRWGSFDISLEAFLEKTYAEGYEGVEIAHISDAGSPKEVLALMDKYNLKFIAQAVLSPKKESVNQYMDRMEADILKQLDYNPIFINAHTGRDYYSFDDNCRVFERAGKISQKTGIKIFHETHRGRALYSTMLAAGYFKKLPNLKVTADFSHWCNVSESLLENHGKAVEVAIKRSEHIHARVGHAQGPQVTHPLTSENELELSTHMKWWKAIIEDKKKNGAKSITITTEFGPEPYMNTLPFTNQPVASQWEINTAMRKYLKENLTI